MSESKQKVFEEMEEVVAKLNDETDFNKAIAKLAKDLKLEVIPPTPEDIEYGNRKHTGMFFRGRKSLYFNNGRIEERKMLVPLKRMSCKGCPTCDFINEQLPVEIERWESLDIEHGETYSLTIETFVDRWSGEQDANLVIEKV